ncbi:uncharacterized protein LOC143484777 [Brachyhypopomus gauderio]|uniref:uncharacterized protein LOC143484777 n=1 Tax=Brachyhypopomus gauderio TaxID=698409 RepID=UPI004042EDE4
MTVNKPVFCMTVMLLVGVVWSGRGCDYPMILTTYRTLTLAELRSLNLTGPFDASNEKSRCPSKKVYHILRSIYGMTQLFACLSEGHHGDSEARVVASMGQLIRQNCRKAPLGKRPNATPCKPAQRQRRGRHRRTQMIVMLVGCWQKLQSVYT